MARPEPEQRTKPPPESGLRFEVRPQAEVRTTIVAVDDVWRFVRDRGTGDRAVAGVAARQLGLITAGQLYAAGISKDAIRTRRRRGTLHLLHRGVYLVGQPVLVSGARELAAVLACRGVGVVSHRSAAGLWGFISSLPDVVDVTVSNECGRKHGRLRVHRVASLSRAERRLWHGIPITSPARTMADLAAGATGDELERAIGEAYALRLSDERELRKTIARDPRRPGIAALRAELNRAGGPALTRHEAERRMKLLIREARLPPPRANARVGGYEVDLLWPGARLIVEVDGYRFHGHRAAFERDRRKQTALVAAGYRVIRVTWRQIADEPLAVIAAIAQALTGSGSGSREQH